MFKIPVGVWNEILNDLHRDSSARGRDKITETDNFILNKYGLKIKAGLTYEIVDENKFILFKIKYSNKL